MKAEPGTGLGEECTGWILLSAHPIYPPMTLSICCFTQAPWPSGWWAFIFPSPRYIPGSGPPVATASARSPFPWLQLSALVTRLLLFAPQA